VIRYAVICKKEEHYVEKRRIEIIEYKDGCPKEVINFLIKITTEEFNRPEWKDYFERRLVD